MTAAPASASPTPMAVEAASDVDACVPDFNPNSARNSPKRSTTKPSAITPSPVRTQASSVRSAAKKMRGSLTGAPRAGTILRAARTAASRRQEGERHAVVAPALPGGRRTVVEHVPVVTAAADAVVLVA